MSRVIARPKALLDGAPEASAIVVPNSGADVYVRQREVENRVSNFLVYLGLLSDPHIPRAGGVLIDGFAGHVICAIQGEDRPTSEVSYGFGLGPDTVKEFIEISRREDEDQELLSYAEILDGDLVFRDSTLQVITDAAKVHELYQLIAIGEDAAEWALD